MAIARIQNAAGAWCRQPQLQAAPSQQSMDASGASGETPGAAALADSWQAPCPPASPAAAELMAAVSETRTDMTPHDSPLATKARAITAINAVRKRDMSKVYTRTPGGRLRGLPRAR